MILLLDIGGSVTRIAGAKLAGDLTTPVLLPTNPDFDAAMKATIDAGKKIAGDEGIEMIVAGIAGEIEDNQFVSGANLPGWKDKPVTETLSGAFNAPVYLVNDAILGGLGEAHQGAGVGAHILLYMTLGTGIGASRIVDGKPDFSVGTETGHQLLLVNGVPTDAEDLVSGKALKKKYGKPGEEIHDPAVWQESARIFAEVLHNTILHFKPDRVVLGGSLFKEGSLSVELVRSELMKITKEPVPEIMHATLGDIGGLYGAHAYAKQVQ